MRYDYLVESFNIIITGLQSNKLMQILSFLMCILSFIFSVAYTIKKWYNKASEDNKISVEELKTLIDNIKDDFNKNLK